MAAGVAEAEADGAGLDGGEEEDGQVVRIRPGRVLGHVHDLDAVLHGEFDRAARVVDDRVEGPVFGILPDRGRADEHRRGDRSAGFLGDLGDGAEVGFEGPRGAVGGDLQLLPGHSPGDGERVFLDGPAGAGKADIGRLDPHRVHETQDLKLLVDGGGHHAGGLEAVAQGLVVEFDLPLGTPGPVAGPVPVVDQVVVHLSVRRVRASRSSSSSSSLWILGASAVLSAAAMKKAAPREPISRTASWKSPGTERSSTPVSSRNLRLTGSTGSSGSSASLRTRVRMPSTCLAICSNSVMRGAPMSPIQASPVWRSRVSPSRAISRFPPAAQRAAESRMPSRFSKPVSAMRSSLRIIYSGTRCGSARFWISTDLSRQALRGASQSTAGFPFSSP